MSTELMETEKDVEMVYDQTLYKENSNTKEIILIVSESEYKRIEAGAFYNNYDSPEDYAKDVTLTEVEADKQRFLKSKDSSKVKK